MIQGFSPKGLTKLLGISKTLGGNVLFAKGAECRIVTIELPV